MVTFKVVLQQQCDSATLIKFIFDNNNNNNNNRCPAYVAWRVAVGLGRGAEAEEIGSR